MYLLYSLLMNNINRVKQYREIFKGGGFSVARQAPQPLLIHSQKRDYAARANPFCPNTKLPVAESSSEELSLATILLLAFIVLTRYRGIILSKNIHL